MTEWFQLIGDGKKNVIKINKLSGREGKNVENEKNGIPEDYS